MFPFTMSRDPMLESSTPSAWPAPPPDHGPRRARTRRRGVTQRGAVRLALGVALLVAVSSLGPRRAEAQFGTGGVVGTITTGTLSSTDFFIAAQSVQGVNLNDRDRTNFLNQGNCLCQKPVWINAVLANTAAITKAAAISSVATVSIYVGQQCDSTIYPNCCLPLKQGVSLAEFRLNGISVMTTVDVLAQNYGPTQCDPHPHGTGACFATTVTSTGGAAGTGGVGGDAGAGGAAGDTGGNGGDSGTGGAGTGGVTGTGGATVLSAPSQTIFLFVSTTGEGYHDVAESTAQWILDTLPPDQPTGLSVQPGTRALITNWTAVDATANTDLAGYQLLCADASGGSVFPGKFTAAFDDRCAPASNDPLAPFSRVDSTFICSDLLSPVSTSFRVKYLTNGALYNVGVVAVDNHRNASIPMPLPGTPIQTLDFYTDYRENTHPEGQATGGCSVGDAGTEHSIATALGGVSLTVLLGLGAVMVRRRRSGRRR